MEKILTDSEFESIKNSEDFSNESIDNENILFYFNDFSNECKEKIWNAINEHLQQYYNYMTAVGKSIDFSEYQTFRNGIEADIEKIKSIKDLLELTKKIYNSKILSTSLKNKYYSKIKSKKSNLFTAKNLKRMDKNFDANDMAMMMDCYELFI